MENLELYFVKWGKEERANLYAHNDDELKAMREMLRKDGFKKSYSGWVERQTRNEWTKDPIKRAVMINIEY